VSAIAVVKLLLEYQVMSFVRPSRLAKCLRQPLTQPLGEINSLAIVGTESIGQKVYRWADITGFLTRWNSRKEWLLDLDPWTRCGAVVMTEFERKLNMFIGINAYIFYCISIMLWIHTWGHLTVKPPCPKPPEYPHMNHRLQDYRWFGSLPFKYPKSRCKECRPLDSECKKQCFDELRAEGHKFIFNPLHKPRYDLEPSHYKH